MFAYNPTVNDTSGQILGQGIVGSAQTKADAQVKLVDDIGSALVGLAGAYADNKALDAKAKGYDQVGQILGDSMFKDNAAVGSYLSELRSVKNPSERIAGYESLFGLVGPMSNAMMAQGRFGLQQQAPYIAADLKNKQNIAGGNVPHGGGMAPVEPPITMDGTAPPENESQTLPPVQSAPPVAPMPGGAQSKEALNRWRRSQGLPPIP